MGSCGASLCCAKPLSMTILYGIPTCESCRKAKKALLDAGFEIDVVDLRKNPQPAQKLEAWAKEFGPAILNKRSTTWRQLSETDRKRPELELISEHPTVIKRPVIEHDGALYLGWGPQSRAVFGL
ncbi:MAG: ArsC/Spx/MgsR family protein [Mangrovicoccus sp.]